MTSKNLLVPEGLDGARVDVGIAQLLGFSRSFAAEIVASGGVTVNGVVARKSDRLEADAHLSVSWTEKEPPRIVPMEVEGFSIIHDDEDIVIVNKPPGVAAHPSVGWTGPTVLGALAAAGFRISTSGPPERTGIVHRLDVGTSGIMMVAKSEIAYSVLKQAFRDRTVHKVYHAVVQGHPDPLAGTIDAPIGRHPGSEWKFAVSLEGKASITHYETLEAFPYATLLNVELETGRTHQIRVHMAAQRHPCVGDTMYGADPSLSQRLGLERQWLHAMRLGFEHPTQNKQVEFVSELAPDLAVALERLREG
jgi:23S rRNA pseudouridine1911/1915/1917 synthase